MRRGISVHNFQRSIYVQLFASLPRRIWTVRFRLHMRDGIGEGKKIIAADREAHYECELLDRLEAGLAPAATEVKALRSYEADAS